MFQGASRHLVISQVSSSFYNLTNKTLLSVFESFDKKLEENVSGQNFFLPDLVSASETLCENWRQIFKGPAIILNAFSKNCANLIMEFIKILQNLKINFRLL